MSNIESNLQLCSPPPSKIVPSLANIVVDWLNKNKSIYTRYVNFVVVHRIENDFRAGMSPPEILKFIMESCDGNLANWLSCLECYLIDFKHESKLTIRISKSFLIELHGLEFFRSWCKEKDVSLIVKYLNRFWMEYYFPIRKYWKYPTACLCRDDFIVPMRIVQKLELFPVRASIIGLDHFDMSTLYENAMIMSIGRFHGTRDIAKRKYYVKCFFYYYGKLYRECDGVVSTIDVAFFNFLKKSGLRERMYFVWDKHSMTLLDGYLRDMSDEILLANDVELNPGPVFSRTYSFEQKLKDVYQGYKFEVQAGITTMFRDLISIPTKFHYVFDKLDGIIDSAHQFLNQDINQGIFQQFSSVLNMAQHSMTLINIVLSIVVLGCLIYFKEIVVIPSLILLVSYIFGWDRKLINLIKDLTSRPVIQDASFALVGQIIFALIAFVGTGVVPGVSYLRKLDLIPKAFVAGTKMYEGAGEAINKIMYYYRKYFLKWSDGQLAEVYGIVQEVSEWSERLDHYLSIEVMKELPKSPAGVHEVEQLYNKMYRWISSLKHWSQMPRACQLIISSRRKQMEDLFKKVSSNNAYDGGPRRAPLTVLFSGGSGVGKSRMCFPLIYALLSARGVTSDYSSEIYSRNVESEFWDNYCGQKAVVVDDAFQTRDSVGKPNPELFEAIRMSNTAPFQPHMADLSDKGRYFTSEIVVYTTNLEGEASNKIHSIHSAEAAIRRLTQNAFQVQIDGDFVFHEKCSSACPECSHNVKDKSLKVSLCKISKCKLDGPCAEHAKRCGYKRSFCPHVYKFQKYDFASGKPDNLDGEFNWDELLKYLVDFDKSLCRINGEQAADLDADAKYHQQQAIIWQAAQREIDAMDQDEIRDTRRAVQECMQNTLLLVQDQVHENPQIQADDQFIDANARPVDPPVPIGTVDLSDQLDCFWLFMLDRFIDKYGFGDTRDSQFEAYLMDFPELWTIYNRSLSYGVSQSDEADMTLKNEYDAGMWLPYSLTRRVDIATVKHQFQKFFSGIIEKVTGIFEMCANNKIILWAISIMSVVSSILGIVAFFRSPRRVKRAYGRADPVVDSGDEDDSVPICMKCQTIDVFGVPRVVMKGGCVCNLGIENSSADLCVRCKTMTVENSSGDFVLKAKTPRVENSSADFAPRVKQAVVENSSGDFIVRNKTISVEDDSLEVQGVYDRTSYDLSKSVVAKNLYRMNLLFDKGYVSVGNVLFVMGTTMLMPYHYYLKIKSEKRYFVIELINSAGVSFKIDCDYVNDVQQLVRSGEKIDACVVTLDPKKCQVRVHPHIIKNFICNADLTGLNNSAYRGNLILLEDRNQSRLVEMNMIVNNIKLHLKNVDQNVLEMDAYGSVVRAADYWMYDADTVNGDCGGPLFIAHAHAMRKLVGIHQSGMPGVGISVVITQEMLQENIRVQSFIDLEDKVIIESNDVKNENVCDGLSFLGKVPRGVLGATSTKIMESPLYDTLPRTTTPAKLFYTGDDNPMKKGLEKFASETPMIDPTLAEFCRMFVRQQMDVGVIKRDRMEYARVLTTEEAIKGVYKKMTVDGEEYDIPDAYLSPINRKTSPGYPYCHQFPGKNKHFWFGDDEWDLENDRARNVIDDVEKIVSDAKCGKVGPVFWIDTLKDERRLIEKVAQNKTRVFCAGSQQFIIAFRKYTLGMSAWTMHNRLFNGVATGVNVYSNEWDQIVRLLHSRGKNIIAGDFSNFDGTMNPQLMWIIAEEMLYFYRNENCTGQCGDNECMFCNLEHPERVAFMTLFVHIINALHINNDNVWQAAKSQPSGNPLTAVFNSYYQMYLFCLCYFILLREQIQECWKNIGYEFDETSKFDVFLREIPIFIRKRGVVPPKLQRFLKLVNMNSFNDLIKIITYGDDGLISVHDSIVDFFNQTTVTRAMKILGHDYTDECKSGKMYVARPIGEVNFLKRKFVFRNASYEAPLCLDTILDIVQFTKKGICSESIFLSNIDVAMRELSLHDECVFEKWKNIIQMELSKKKYNVPLLSYGEYRIMVLNNALFVESNDVCILSSSRGKCCNENAHLFVRYTTKSNFLFHLSNVLMLCQSYCLNTSVYNFDFSAFQFSSKQQRMILNKRQSLGHSYGIKF